MYEYSDGFRVSGEQPDVYIRKIFYYITVVFVEVNNVKHTSRMMINERIHVGRFFVAQ